jgi:hypothetical protein
MWEYLTITIDTVNQLRTTLDRHGENNWEFASMSYVAHVGFVVIMKRRNP